MHQLEKLRKQAQLGQCVHVSPEVWLQFDKLLQKGDEVMAMKKRTEAYRVELDAAMELALNARKEAIEAHEMVLASFKMLKEKRSELDQWLYRRFMVVMIAAFVFEALT